MNPSLLKELDDIYVRYGYEPRKSRTTRVYLFTKSIYNGADIVKTGTDEEAEELRKQYSSAGFAVKVREFSSINEAEELLFKDFFKADGVLHNLKRRYDSFVERLMDNFPDKSKYEYIKCSYECTIFENNKDESITTKLSTSDPNCILVKDVYSKINDHSGPLLVVIEAPAGYGKTCTAFEILNEFIVTPSNKLPFFTELSRDRRASVFRHILSYEIEEQFSNRVDSSVVIHQIKKGRIPLIIDGFDELISKDFSFSSSQFEQVESMLSTIVDLLTENAKIIITSRKTAIFNSEEFHNWMLDRNINYSLHKITITEPSIEDWLTKERLAIVSDRKLPVQEIANPVLLTYLRYVELDELREMGVEGKSIVERYFNFLLTREQTRQGLLIEPEGQLEIFRNLVCFLTECGIKTETKDFIKDLILEYNRPILEDTKKKYVPDKRPRIDQLAEILSNHAFLDRKENGMIGVVNEFVLGTLIGETLISGKYGSSSPTANDNLSQTFALLAIQAYQVQPKENKLGLWGAFNSYPFQFDPQFYFKIDLEFKGEIARKYSQTTLNDFVMRDILFLNENQFESVVFSNCVFTNCVFSFVCFSNSSFVNCRFFNCTISEVQTSYSKEYFTINGCESDNNFTTAIFEIEAEPVEESSNIEKDVMDLYFKKGSNKPRYKQLSQIKKDLPDYDFKVISRILNKLESNKTIIINGDLSFITRSGITYYNSQYRKQ
jgi:NACHT domain